MDYLSDFGIIIIIILIVLFINMVFILFVLLLFWCFRGKLSVYWEELNVKISVLQYCFVKVKLGKLLFFDFYLFGIEVVFVNCLMFVVDNCFLLAEMFKLFIDLFVKKNSKVVVLEKVQQVLEILEQEISSLDMEMFDEIVVLKLLLLFEQKLEVLDELDVWCV